MKQRHECGVVTQQGPAAVQTGLFDRDGFKEARPALEQALISMLINPVADGAKEQLVSVLWGVGETDWDAFLRKLAELCASGPAFLRGRGPALQQPFTDQSGSLHDFAHFHACMDDLVNDIRFFRRLGETGPAGA